MVVLTREQLEERLSTLHQASLELVGVLSLDEVLQRIGPQESVKLFLKSDGGDGTACAYVEAIFAMPDRSGG